ncbi:MAG: ribosome silencing factor [Acidobacteriota bacterium]
MKLATVTDADISQRVRRAVAAAEDRKAFELRVLNLSRVSGFTDFFVICSGTSDRQVQAIAEAIQRDLRAFGARPLHVEGQRSGSWVLLDFGAFVVHVFDQETRAFYGLENLWADAPEVTADFTS